MQWVLREEVQEFISSCGRFKIKNSGPRDGDRYCVWGLFSWSCQGDPYQEYCRLLKTGTLDECKQFGG